MTNQNISSREPCILQVPNVSDPKRYVAGVTKASGSSFFLPMLLLPRARREAMLALYAFCRETDDVADEIEDSERSGALLKAWAQEIESLYAGKARHPVCKALAEPIGEYGLEKQHFLHILEGFDMDRSGVMVRPTLEQLERYCYCVASCVGLLSVNIFGYRCSTIPNFALHLGHAFQLTNILRDVAEDADRGRIYLPKELLQKYDLEDVSPEKVARAPGVELVCAEIGAMARNHFTKASNALPANERGNMRPALLMQCIYQAYLNRIERGGFRVDKPYKRLGKYTKIALILKGLLRTF